MNVRCDRPEVATQIAPKYRTECGKKALMAIRNSHSLPENRILAP